MVHINELNSHIHYQILYFASGGPAEDIDEWKHKLTLLQVCTKWYGLLKSYVFSRGFINIHSLKRNENPYINMKSCVYYADTDIVCRSNLGIITGRDKHDCDCVSELKVGVDRILDIGMYGHILKKLSTLGVGYWLNISSLKFDSTLRFPPSLNHVQQNIEELSATVSKHIVDFQNSLPNITHLELDIAEDDVMRIVFYIIIDHYSQRLQYLHSYCPDGQRLLPLFSKNLTSLLLHVGASVYQNSSFYARSLEYLHLYSIPSSRFSWWAFHEFTTPGYIEFENLKTLYLLYADQTDEEKIISKRYSKQTRPYGSHMLRFPRLQSLTLHNPPVDCDVLFTDTMPTQLNQLGIYGNANSIAAASRLRFSKIDDLTVVVYRDEALSDEFYFAADSYFGYTNIGRSCVAIIEPPVDIRRIASWVNVTDLNIHSIEFNELLEHIPNFYSLQEFRVDNIHLSDRCMSIIRSGLEEEEKGEFEFLDTRLECIFFVNIEPDNPYNLLAILNHLLLRTYLKRVKNSDEGHAIVEKSFLPEKFPYIQFSG